MFYFRKNFILRTQYITIYHLLIYNYAEGGRHLVKSRPINSTQQGAIGLIKPSQTPGAPLAVSLDPKTGWKWLSGSTSAPTAAPPLLPSPLGRN